jgi:archaellum component FlaC
MMKNENTMDSKLKRELTTTRNELNNYKMRYKDLWASYECLNMLLNEVRNEAAALKKGNEILGQEITRRLQKK